MKKYFLSAFAAMLLFACDSTTQSHEGHNHTEGESCASETEHNHEGEEAAKADEHAHAEGITLSPEQAAELGVEWREVAPQQFVAAIHTSGTIQATPGDEASVVATTSGIVSFAGKRTVVGTAIGKGASLLTINSSELTDDNLSMRIADARATLSKAQNDYKRIELLYVDQLVTAAQMEEAKLNLTMANQALETLTKNTKGGNTKNVTSTIGGYLTSLSVKDGDYVTQGQLLATVSSSRTVVLKADLPSRFFDKVSLINSANFSTPYNSQTYDIAQMGGKILAAAHTTVDYTLPIRFEIENRAGLVAGSVVDVYLKTVAVQNAIAVPVTALTEEQGGFYVYLKTCVDTYEKRAVRVGDSNGIESQILSGLNVGETVVTKGAYFVRLASMSAAIPDGHNH